MDEASRNKSKQEKDDPRREKYATAMRLLHLVKSLTARLVPKRTLPKIENAVPRRTNDDTLMQLLYCAFDPVTGCWHNGPRSVTDMTLPRNDVMPATLRVADDSVTVTFSFA